MSGGDAKLVEALAPFGLKIVVLDGPIGAASALKMSYAGITKGLIAVSCSMILAAQRAGVSDALYNELSASQAALLAGFARGVPDMFSKAYRWVAEMQEISGFAGPGPAEQEIFSGAADFYARIARDFEGANQEIAVLRDFFPSGLNPLRRRPITTEAIGSAATHPSLRGALATKQSRGHNMRGASNPDGRTAAPGLLRFARNDGQGIGSLVSACRLRRRMVSSFHRGSSCPRRPRPCMTKLNAQGRADRRCDAQNPCRSACASNLLPNSGPRLREHA